MTDWVCPCGERVLGLQCKCGMMLAKISSIRINTVMYNIVKASEEYDIQISTMYPGEKNVAYIYYKEKQ